MHGISNQNTRLYPLTTIHQFIWRHHRKCGALGRSSMEVELVGQHHRDAVLPSPISAPTPLKWSSKKSVGPAWVAFPKAWAKKRVGPPPHQCRTFPLLLEQMGRDIFCSRWMWRRRTNRWPYFPPMSSPSTSLWTARLGCYEWWDNRLTAQHLPWGLVHASSGW